MKKILITTLIASSIFAGTLEAQANIDATTISDFKYYCNQNDGEKKGDGVFYAKFNLGNHHWYEREYNIKFPGQIVIEDNVHKSISKESNIKIPGCNPINGVDYTCDVNQGSILGGWEKIEGGKEKIGGIEIITGKDSKITIEAIENGNENGIRIINPNIENFEIKINGAVLNSGIKKNINYRKNYELKLNSKTFANEVIFRLVRDKNGNLKIIEEKNYRKDLSINNLEIELEDSLGKNRTDWSRDFGFFEKNEKLDNINNSLFAELEGNSFNIYENIYQRKISGKAIYKGKTEIEAYTGKNNPDKLLDDPDGKGKLELNPYDTGLNYWVNTQYTYTTTKINFIPQENVTCYSSELSSTSGNIISSDIENNIEEGDNSLGGGELANITITKINDNIKNNDYKAFILEADKILKINLDLKNGYNTTIINTFEPWKHGELENYSYNDLEKEITEVKIKNMSFGSVTKKIINEYQKLNYLTFTVINQKNETIAVGYQELGDNFFDNIKKLKNSDFNITLKEAIGESLQLNNLQEIKKFVDNSENIIFTKKSQNNLKLTIRGHNKNGDILGEKTESFFILPSNTFSTNTSALEDFELKANGSTKKISINLTDIFGNNFSQMENNYDLTGKIKFIGENADKIFISNARFEKPGILTFEISSYFVGEFKGQFEIYIPKHKLDIGLPEDESCTNDLKNCKKIIIKSDRNSDGKINIKFTNPLTGKLSIEDGNLKVGEKIKFILEIEADGLKDKISNGKICLDKNNFVFKNGDEILKSFEMKLTSNTCFYFDNFPIKIEFEGIINVTNEEDILKPFVLSIKDLNVQYNVKNEVINGKISTGHIGSISTYSSGSGTFGGISSTGLEVEIILNINSNLENSCTIPTLGVKIEGQSNQNEYSIGGKGKYTDFSTSELRDIIRKNAVSLTRNMRNGNFVNGIKYLENSDIKISDISENFETLIIKNGNLIIDKDLEKTSPIGIIVLNDKYDVTKGKNQKGNIEIKNEVKTINAIIYADGGLISDGNGEQKLEINGSLFTRNTIGGSVMINNSYKLPGGRNSNDFEIAKLYDLNTLRKFPNNFCNLSDEEKSNFYTTLIKYNPKVQSNPPKGFTIK